MAKLQVFFIVAVSLCHCSQQSIFSSLIRNNLNRYLKNPLFTKSLVPGWPGEQQEHGTAALISPQSGPINEFIKSQNKFANEHLMEPYGSNYNFDLMALNNEFPGLIPGPPSAHGAMQAQRQNSKISNANSKVMPPLNGAESKNRVLHNNGTKTFFDDKISRHNSKSLTVSNSNVNAYSDTAKLQMFNHKNANLYSSKKPNNTNMYADTSRSSSSSSLGGGQRMANRFGSQNTDPLADNFENHLHSGNKYNQEKALNLKLEYGFKPLPNQHKSKSQSDGDDFRKDFTVTNTIQMNDPFDFIKANEEEDLKTGESPSENSEEHESGNNIYSSFGATAAASSDEDSERNRAMKSLSFDSLSTNVNNHLGEFAPDYKKYISYPMETESSDIHKLAFTGMESFKPDHSYVDSSLSMDQRLVDSLSHYPNIKHFKSQGIDCARNSGYCEYDSSYPKEHVNSIVSNCSHLIDAMYIDMPENLSDFTGYKSFIEVGRVNSHKSNSSLCDAERKYIRPSVIQDVEGHFYLILQSSFYFQQVPVEICTKPGLSCNVVGRCNAQVKCTQKYRTHMLISIDSDWTPANGPKSHELYGFSSHSNGHGSKARPCPRMRMYRLPSTCVCELSRV